MGVNASDHPGKYLGMPMEWGRSKKEVLKFLREKMVKKMSSWKQQMLSMAGREVLIKSFINVIPIYIMSCLKFPRAWCAEMSALIARFWWGQQGDGRKIHWAS